MFSIDASSMQGRDLDTMFSFSGAEQRTLLKMAASLKKRLRPSLSAPYLPLTGRTMSMIFQKRSTRTRVSAEGGFNQLGGHAIFLGACYDIYRERIPLFSYCTGWIFSTRAYFLSLSVLPALPSMLTGSEDIQLGKNESLVDTARVLGRFNDIVLARVYAHADIDELCRECDKPVINALSDTHHPLQLLADMQTLEEQLGAVEGRTIAWVGDGNNILLSFLSSAGALGYNVRYATPPGYEPDAAVLAKSQALANAAGVTIVGTHDPLIAVRGADAIVTDTWVSMGQEAEASARTKSFAGYQVTEEMGRRGGAKPGWIFLHCLPRKPNEVDDDVFYGKRSVVWDEAENRKWTFQAVALVRSRGCAASERCDTTRIATDVPTPLLPPNSRLKSLAAWTTSGFYVVATFLPRRRYRRKSR